jgi:hypothetical protein
MISAGGTEPTGLFVLIEAAFCTFARRQTILGLLRLKWPERRIARETGFHRATIGRVALELAAELSKCTTPGEVATDAKPPADPEVPTGAGALAQRPRAIPRLHHGRSR